MRKFWPKANITYDDGFCCKNTDTISTYVPYVSLEKALEQFNIWEENFDISNTIINVYENEEKIRVVDVAKIWTCMEDCDEENSNQQSSM